MVAQWPPGAAATAGSSRRSCAVREGVVSSDVGHENAEIREDAGLAAFLGHRVLGVLTPGVDRRFVPPGGNGYIFPRCDKALKSFHRQETVDFLQLRTKLRSEIEVGIGLAFFHCDFEDNNDATLIIILRITHVFNLREYLPLDCN